MLKAKEKLLQDGFGFEILNWPFADSGSDVLFNSSNYVKSKLEKGIRISNENFSLYDSIEVYPLYAVNNIDTK